MEKTIKVLWIEDDPDYAKAFIMTHEAQLDIDHFKNWEQGYKALIDNWQQYQAIILDAVCCSKRGGVANAENFLMGTFSTLSRFEAEHKRVIPWYVLSAGNSQNIANLIPEDRIRWDYDWMEKPFYHKATDEVKLVERIIAYANSHKPFELQIREGMFKPVFEAIAGLNIDKLDHSMISMLLPFADPTAEYENKCFGEARVLLEMLFDDMDRRKLLCEATKGNNDWRGQVLAGEKKEISKQQRLKQLSDKGELECPLFGKMPKIMTTNLKNILKTGNLNAHATSNRPTQNRPYSISEYREAVGKSDLLMRSFALQLCDMVLWYKNFLDNRSK